ncbi:MAG TPA: thiamine diphosphokinase [Opitutae bacterium]|nr:thiamine diphosphokinase [Puniceicoccaceae bacterium]HCY57827.1 thiamine diphosphokinase [Opitutae bacterium]
MGKTLLVLNGKAPTDGLLRWRFEESDTIVAVDGGWNVLRNSELLPDALIGDLDSCEALDQIRENFPELKISHILDPDTTDFEKAIKWVGTHTETTELIILGGVGKRSDHFLSNLLVSLRMNPTWSVVFDDDNEWISRVNPSSSLLLGGRKGTTLSILPLVPCNGVCSRGLKWELTNESLSPDSKFSQSNLCTSDEVEISCESGNLFVILSKRL